MEDGAVTLARQVAARLATSDPSVVPLVEAELARTAGQPPEQFPVEWLDLAKLLVPSVFAAYPIIKDWHRGRRDVLRRRLKLNRVQFEARSFRWAWGRMGASGSGLRRRAVPPCCPSNTPAGARRPRTCVGWR